MIPGRMFVFSFLVSSQQFGGCGWKLSGSGLGEKEPNAIQSDTWSVETGM